MHKICSYTFLLYKPSMKVVQGVTSCRLKSGCYKLTLIPFLDCENTQYQQIWMQWLVSLSASNKTMQMHRVRCCTPISSYCCLTRLLHVGYNPVEGHLWAHVSCVVDRLPTGLQWKAHFCQLHYCRLVYFWSWGPDKPTSITITQLLIQH